MPLHTSSHPRQLVQAESPSFLIFFSSGSPPWCPDCVRALPAIHAVFGEGITNSDGSVHEGPTGYMVYVGDRPEWKDPNNQYRTQYGVKSVPTILKWEEGRETARLEDEAGCASEAQVRVFVGL